MTEDIEILRKRLERAEAALEAIRNEEVDAVVGTRNVFLLQLQETEQELRNSEKRLSIVMGAAKVASWEIDLATGTLTSCPRLSRMFGLQPKDCPQSRDEYLRLYGEEDRQRIQTADERAIETKEQYEMECRIRRPDGLSRWFRSLVIPMADERDRVVKLMGVTTDITRERRTRGMLQESERRFRNMAEDSPFPIWVHDAKGRIAYVNRSYCEFFGITQNELKMNGWQALVHPEDGETYTKEFMNALKEKRAFTAVARVRHCDGEWRWIQSSATPRFSGPGRFRGMVGNSMDITNHVRAEEKIAMKNEELSQALAERDKFFSIIAHDLRSPFIGFLMFIKLLTEQVDKFSLNEIQRLSVEMQESAQNLHRLLENLLQWALTRRGEIDYQPVRCDLTETVGFNINLLKMVALQKNFKFRCDIPEGLHVSADKSMLNTILRNLLTNAVKFSNRSGTVRVSAVQNGDFVQVSVKDDGLGICQESLSNLFKLDKMHSRKGTGGEKGTGLGLLLCKEFIEKHGGKIWVKSELGEGTTVFFTLPVSD